LLLLIAQVVVGIIVATNNRWGAAWSTNTTTPYLWSLATLQPSTNYIGALPAAVKLHLILAWIIFMLVPFSRLVHLFSLPIGYLWRPYIKIVWNNPRRLHALQQMSHRIEDSRRYFLRGAVGVGGAAVLLSMGVLDRLIMFFRGPDMTTDEQAELLEKKLERLEITAQQRELELERLRKDYIHVAQMNQLSDQDGKYFIDYQMRPALAFKDERGMPLLISAKCTHLGCTVAKTLDKNDRLLCPCHMSYFDVKTGEPTPGSPTDVPLPRLGWVLMDAAGEIVATKGPDGEVQGEVDSANLDSLGVYIAKQYQETA